MDTPDLPFIDVSRSLLYRLSKPVDQTHLRMLDSSFVTDKIFRVEYRASDGIGFGLSVNEIELDSPIYKHFPDDESESASEDNDKEEEEKGFTVVVEDTNTSLPITPPDAATSTTSLTHDIVGFITVKFSAWNSRLIITDIEVHPFYRRQGIGRNLINIAERIACSRYPIRQIWLEVSNVNYPAVRSNLSMGFLVAGLDLSLYTATAAEGEFAIFLWKRVG